MNIFIRCAKNWKVWVPILFSIIAVFISTCSNRISKEANRIASKNNELTEGLEKLNFRPIICLHTLFKTVGKFPPHFTVTNIGPIEARQIKIRMYEHRYFPQTEKIHISGTSSENEIYIPKLALQKPKAYKFNISWLTTNARLAQQPQYNIMEIKITYRRPQDLKEYDESAFYFVNPDGIWVPENSSSLNTELYEKIKKALFKRKSDTNISIYKDFRGDVLHSNK